MKKALRQWRLFLGLALAFLVPRAFGANVEQTNSTAARINDFQDDGCHKTPGGPGAPLSGAVGAGGNNAFCPTCQDATGMPRWWVDEPYINLHLVDEPLSYTTSSGQKMAFRFTYKQRFALPGLDQIPSMVIQTAYNRITYDYYVNTMHEAYTGAVNTGGMTNAAWSHNWMMNIVFWDAAAEYPTYQTPAFASYEALAFNPDGGIDYFTYNAGNGTLNPATQTNDPVSQAQLVLVSYTNVPVADTNGIYWGTNTAGLKLAYPDGSKDVFGLLATVPSVTQTPAISTGDALLTQRIDPQGRVTQLGYQYVTITNFNSTGFNLSFFRLRYVVDSDGRTNTFVYASSTVSPWLVQEIDDPFGRKATFAYTNSTWLNSITDAATNTSSFAYASSPATSGWLQSLTTPYGTTSFSYYQVLQTSNYQARLTYVAEPDGASQLFTYIHNSTGVVEATNTSPTVPGVVFDNGTTGGADDALYQRNSFHWDRKQTSDLSSNVLYYLPNNMTTAMAELTTNDYMKARMQHWLLGSDYVSLTETLSSTRDPSPDPGGQIEGQWTWNAYNGNSTNADIEGTSKISATGQLLPDGTAQYTSYNYYSSGLVSSNAQTYATTGGGVGVLTNWFQYALNSVDLSSTSNSIGQFVGMGYTNHEVISITNALNQVTTLAYDSTTRNLLTVTNYSGQSVNYTYYASNATTGTGSFLNTVTVQPEGLTTTISDYTSALPHSVQVSGTGLTTLSVSNTWDNLNRLTGTLFPDGTTISNVYTNLDLVAQTDRLGQTTHFAYDALEHLLYVTNALNKVTSFTWCSCGSLTSITDPLTNTILLNRDNQERLTNVIFPDGSSFTNQFDLLGRLTNRIDGTGKSISWNYNNQGLVTSIIGPYGQLLGIGYDAVGNALTMTNSDGVVTTGTYDLLNRVITNAWPDGSRELFQYSTNGLIAYTNQDGQFTHFARDGSGRITALTNNLSQVTQFAYNARDQVSSLIDGLGDTTTWQFNQYGWMTNKLNNLNASVQTNAFDADGQLINRWLPATGNTLYGWDAVGNLTNITYPQRTNNYAFDAVRRMTNMTDIFGTNVWTTSRTYTPNSLLASETSPWASDTLSFLYNQGRRTNLSLTQPTGTWNQSYAYDSVWRLQTLASPAGTFGYGYSSANPASALFRTLSLPNGASISNYYDSLARLDYTGLLNYWGHPLDGYSYQNDAWGLGTNITRQLGLTTNIVTANYDGIGELASWTAKESGGAARQNEQLGYNFDAANNLQYRTNGAMVQTFTVNTLNEISNVTRSGTFTVTGATPAPVASVTVNGATAQTNGDFTFASTNNTLANGNNTFTIIAQSKNLSGTLATNAFTVNLPTNVVFQYDANGNLTNDGTRWFFYDAENQLTNVTVASQYQVVYLYDGLTRRRIRRAYAWQSGAWALTNEVRYICDGPNVIQERDTTNNVLVTYTRGLGLSMSLSGAGGIGGLLARTDTNGTTYYHCDGNGNVTALIDGNGNIVARYEYDGFGRLIGKWGSLADANVYRFSSKEYDPVTGLYYFGGRYYDPVLQRWLNRDPIGENGGVNLYGFVGNNPVNNVDPDGLDPWYYWLNPFSYSSAYARHAGQAMLDEMAKRRGHIDYDTEMEGLNEGRHHDDTYDLQKSQQNIVGMIQEDAKEGANAYVTGATSVTPTAAGAGCVAAVARIGARNLAEQLALKEAEAGAGTRIMEGLIKDPKFPENIWAKMSHIHGDIEIHYWQNLQTGDRIGFKFKN